MKIQERKEIFPKIKFMEDTDMKTIIDFGENLTELRKNKGITQDQLAEKLDISRQAVSKWESGVSFPDMKIFPDLCKILDTTPNQLFCGEEKKAIKKKIKTKQIFLLFSPRCF